MTHTAVAVGEASFNGATKLVRSSGSTAVEGSFALLALPSAWLGSTTLPATVDASVGAGSGALDVTFGLKNLFGVVVNTSLSSAPGAVSLDVYVVVGDDSVSVLLAGGGSGDESFCALQYASVFGSLGAAAAFGVATPISGANWETVLTAMGGSVVAVDYVTGPVLSATYDGELQFTYNMSVGIKTADAVETMTTHT